MKKSLPVLSEKNNKMLADKAGQMLLEKIPVDQKTLNRAVKLLEPKNLKRIAIGAVGGTILVSVLSNLGHDRMYQAAVAREIKKQIGPLQKKLEDLEAQNMVLWQQNEDLKAQLNKLSEQK